MKLNMTAYLWTLFAIGALGYLIQIRGQNVPLWIILFSLAGMVAMFAFIIHVVVPRKQQQQAQNPPPAQRKKRFGVAGKPRSKK